MSSPAALPPALTGAHFLVHDCTPADVFTPEDRSMDERQMAAIAAQFMDKEVFPNLAALEHQEPGLARSLFNRAGELGIFGIEVPEEFGGLGLGKTAALGVNEQLARLGGFGITCAAHTGIGSQPLIYFGTLAQKEKYLPRLASGEWMAAYCLSEAGSGSDALGMKAKAVLSPDGTHYILNGVKMWITNAAWADLFTVFAKVDGHHVTAFLVERSFPGVSTGKEEHKLGIKSSSTRRLILDDVRVPVANVLGAVGKGAYIAFNILNFGRFSLGAANIGAARDQLRIAATYATERQQFGKPLAAFGLIQHKLAVMAARVYAGESATHRTAGLIDAVAATGELLAGVNPGFLRALDEFALECSIVKVRGSEILFGVADESLQIHGGYGFTEEFPPARALRDARINRIFEGTNEINRLFIPTLLQRRAQRGRFPLDEACRRALALTAASPAADDTDPLAAARQTLTRAKQAVFVLFDLGVNRFQAKLADEQEMLGALADLIAEVYLAESAILRALKVPATRAAREIHRQLALFALHEALPRMERAARTVLAGAAPENFAMHFAEVRRLLEPAPLDTIRLGRAIAAAVTDRRGHPCF